MSTWRGLFSGSLSSISASDGTRHILEILLCTIISFLTNCCSYLHFHHKLGTLIKQWCVLQFKQWRMVQQFSLSVLMSNQNNSSESRAVRTICHLSRPTNINSGLLKSRAISTEESEEKDIILNPLAENLYIIIYGNLEKTLRAPLRQIGFRPAYEVAEFVL